MVSISENIAIIRAALDDIEYGSAVVAKADPFAKGSGIPTTLTDLSDGFHKYALQWTADTLTWAVDDQIIYSVPTPASLVNRPCYLIANLAVGGVGSWPGAPDKDTVFPAEMKIRSIQAWANPSP